MAYVDVVDELVAGTDPLTAIARSAGEPARRSDVREVLETAPRQPIQELRPTGYVLDTLAVGVWALCQPRSLEETLVDVVNLGGDADTTGAVAGGLLGAPDGIGAIPKRWHQQLEYAPAYDELADQLLERRLSQQ